MIKRNNIIGLALTFFIFSSIGKFIKKAYMAGRTIELLVSTSVMIGIYYVLGTYYNSVPTWSFFIPFVSYVIYWCFLFSYEKITTSKANYMWADRRWWWDLDGWEFEEEVAKVFRLNGYRANVTRRTNDDGVDIIMYKDSKKILVQCKHYSAPVGVTVARELNGIREDFNANELILVASSGATQPCMDFLRNKPYFRILNLEDIISMGLRPHSS